MFHQDLLVSVQQLHATLYIATLCCMAILALKLLLIFLCKIHRANVFHMKISSVYASASYAKCITRENV